MMQKNVVGMMSSPGSNLAEVPILIYFNSIVKINPSYVISKQTVLLYVIIPDKPALKCTPPI